MVNLFIKCQKEKRIKYGKIQYKEYLKIEFKKYVKGYDKYFQGAKLVTVFKCSSTEADIKKSCSAPQKKVCRQLL